MFETFALPDKKVVDGYSVVKALEACGDRSGNTAFEVSVADCGPLPAGTS